MGPMEQGGLCKDEVTAEQSKQSSQTSHVLYASPPPITRLQLWKHTCGLTTPKLPLRFLGTYEESHTFAELPQNSI